VRAHASRGATVLSAPAAKPSLRVLQKELTRQRVIESALAVFEAKGFTAATMDDIAGEAAMSRATIYLHFENKTDILRAAVAQLPELMPLLHAIFHAPERERRRAAFAALNDYWLAHLGPVWRHVREAAAVDAAMKQWVLHFVRDQTAMVRATFERAGVPPAMAEARAFMIMCLWHEYVERTDDAERQLDRAAAVDALTDLFDAAATPPER
jgi:AcrR family transcriptional regulator